GAPPGSYCDPWIAYSRPDCCQWCGADGPIFSEYYWRSGVSLPVAGGIFHHALSAGWMNTVGARSMFFNKAGSAAWTVDLGLSFTYNNANNAADPFAQQVNLLGAADPLTGNR